MPDGRAEALVVAAFALVVVCVIGLVVLYWHRDSPQWEGVLLAGALGSMAYGVGMWAKHFMPAGQAVDERRPLESSPDERAELARDFARGERIVTRRGLILKSFGLALGALGLAALAPLRSLGPRPGSLLRRTGWRPGMGAVDSDGQPVTVDSLQVGGVLTIFPANGVEPEMSQTLLIRLAEGELKARAGREDWAPSGFVAYSKICTHVGCPVGLYNTETHQLLCPCHQSLFDVLDGARPVFGPATRALPQLPLRIDEGGRIVAMSDYTEPVGPGFWSR